MAEARQAVEGTFSQAGWPEGLAQYNEYQKARFDLSAFLYESMDSEANGREEEKFAQVKAKTTSGLAEKGIDIAKLDGIMDKAIES
jgi:hypothetical protein